MKEIRVLIPCSNIHTTGLIDCLHYNMDGRNVVVYATNCNESDMPSNADERITMERVDSPTYIESLINICLERKVQVVLPCNGIDLMLMSKNKNKFEEKGIMVAVMDYDIIKFANDKVLLNKKFEKFMPRQVVVRGDIHDVDLVLSLYDKTCCKFKDQCGGKGFAVVDEEKACNPALFHKYGEKHYITSSQLRSVVRNKSTDEVILQEYHEGKDYTVSVLAEHGEVKYICGYYGYLMEFGAIMKGEIMVNKKAFVIAKSVVSTLKLDGCVALDFIVKDNGEVYLLEVNPRISASLPFVSAAGCDMVYLMIKGMLGESVPDKVNITEGLKMAKYFDARYYI